MNNRRDEVELCEDRGREAVRDEAREEGREVVGRVDLGEWELLLADECDRGLRSSTIPIISP